MRISFRLFGFGADVDLTDIDRETFAKLIRKLAGHRVLVEPRGSEYVGEVAQSVQRLRIAIDAAIEEVAESSRIADGLHLLQQSCTRFLTDIRRISEELKGRVQVAEENLSAGVDIDSAERKLVAHYKRRGSPDLLTNTNLNLSQVEPIGYQHDFAKALGRLRGEFGIILSNLCSATLVTAPAALAELTSLGHTSREAEG